jgi:hypothetical protein
MYLYTVRFFLQSPVRLNTSEYVRLVRNDTPKQIIFQVSEFSLKKLNDVEGKEQYHFKISDKFVALENLNYDVVISTSWECVGENIKISVKESFGN